MTSKNFRERAVSYNEGGASLGDMNGDEQYEGNNGHSNNAIRSTRVNNS
jgi:hypothetical protein